ncbi:MAG: ParB N-terminal domain-containing protein [Chloroflexota bacterium]|nr:ParB N-terminal domain-containing protein [Chloroflexota bacterium]
MNNMTEITVPLNRLKVSEHNVRKMPADAMSDAELKASLVSVGLLQNLIIHEDENDEGYYAVDTGGRRARLLQELVAEGAVSEDAPIRCLLIEDASRAVELSLIENEMREGMHPADQVEAYAKLVRQGMTAAEIAVRFGMSDRTVEQRLRLGNVSPVLMQAYRDGQTRLETLKAFALTTNQKLQEEVWNSLHQTRGYVDDYMVRQILLEERVPGSDRLVEFVTIEEYEKAGGRVTRDLFASEDNHGIWLDDPALVYDLADRKLAAIADGLKEAWKWVEFELEFGYEKEAKFNKIHPVEGEWTPAEKSAVEELTSRLEQIHEAGVSDETRDEFNSVHKEIRALSNLKASRNTYTEEQREIAGCVVTINYDGKARIYEGLVRPADMPKAASKASKDVVWRDPEKQVRVQTGYSKKLMDEMRVERTKVVRSHLSGAFKEAFDLLLFQMAREVFCVERYFSHALDVELFRIGSRHGASESLDVGSLSLDWVREEDDAVAFEKMRKLSKKKKETLFAACIATTYKGQLTVDTSAAPEVELVVGDLSIDFAADYRPTAENFWGRISKPRILEIAEETLGVEWADAHSNDKKAALAAAMEQAFAAGGDVPEGVTPEGRAAALAWTPVGFSGRESSQ